MSNVDFLLCFNHHDVVVGWGDATPWVASVVDKGVTDGDVSQSEYSFNRKIRTSVEDDILFVSQNCTHSPEWQEDSFLGELDDAGILNLEKYWLLEWALHSLSARDPDRETLSKFFKIFARISFLVSSHLDPEDAYCIVGTDKEQVLEFLERVQMVVEGVFSGDMSSCDTLDPRNPYL